ncbi:MAG: hypothetical protein ACHQ49_13255 [Elusimicrobiota bacterium]
MKYIIFAAVLLAAAVHVRPAAAADQAANSDVWQSALDHFKKAFGSPAFTNPRLGGPQRRLTLSATAQFAGSPDHQASWVGDALSQWRRSMDHAGINPRTEFVVVTGRAGGTLWQDAGNGTATKVDEWSDQNLPPAPGAGAAPGKFLLSASGSHTAGGGAATTTGVTATFGRTLANDSYEFAVTDGITGSSPSGSSTLTDSLGFLARRMFRVTPVFGWNVGGQYLYSLTDTSSDGTVSTSNTSTVYGLVGVNFYVGPGRLDFTTAIGNSGNYNVNFGYTSFFTFGGAPQ